MVSGSDDGVLQLWNMKSPNPSIDPITLPNDTLVPVTGSSEQRTTPTTSPIRSVRFSRNGEWLVTVLDDRRVFLRQLTALGPSRSAMALGGHDANVTQARFVAGGVNDSETWLLTAGDDAVVRKWDLTKENSVFPRQNETEFNVTAFSDDQRWFVEGDKEGTVRVWDLTASDLAKQRFDYRGTKGAASVLKVSGDQQFVCGHEDSSLFWFDLTKLNIERQDSQIEKNTLSNDVVRKLEGHEGAVRSIGVSVDGKQMVTGGDDRKIILWDLKNDGPTRRNVPSFRHEGPVKSAAVSTKIGRLATLSGGIARLWDTTSDPLTHETFTASSKFDGELTITPNGRWLVVGSPTTLWNLASRFPTRDPIVLPGQTNSVFGVSNSGHMLVTSTAGSLFFWDLDSSNPSTASVSADGKHSSVSSVQFSRDDRWLAVAYDDLTIGLWSISEAKGKITPKRYQRFSGHDGSIISMSFGKHYLLTASQDASVRRWPLTKGSRSLAQSLELAAAVCGRNIGHDEWDQYVKTTKYSKTFDSLPIHPSVYKPTQEEKERVAAGVDELVSAQKQFLPSPKDGNNEEFIKTYRAELQMARQSTEAREHLNNAIVAAKQGKQESAIKQLSQSYQLEGKEQNESDVLRRVREWQVQGLIEKARITAHPDDVDEADEALLKTEKLFGQALELALQLGSDHEHADIEPIKDAASLVANALTQLGKEYIQNEQIGQAEKCFAKAFELQIKAGETPPVADAEQYTNRLAANWLIENGWRQIHEGKGSEAIVDFQRAMEFDASKTIDGVAAAAQLLSYTSRSVQDATLEDADKKARHLTPVLQAAKVLDPNLQWDPDSKAKQFVADVLLSSVHRMIGQGAKTSDETLIKTFEKAKEFDQSLSFIKDKELYFKRVTARLLIRRGSALAIGNKRKDATLLLEKAVELDKGNDGSTTLDFSPASLADLLAGWHWFNR